jgi:predicted RNA binding protein YcfA (HicA-like mRNA interferase family)
MLSKVKPGVGQKLSRQEKYSNGSRATRALPIRRAPGRNRRGVAFRNERNRKAFARRTRRKTQKREMHIWVFCVFRVFCGQMLPDSSPHLANDFACCSAEVTNHSSLLRASAVKSLAAPSPRWVHRSRAPAPPGALVSDWRSRRPTDNFRCVPRKIRQLVADLEQAGFCLVPGGKGSHRKFRHPKLAGSLILSGHDGEDARHYQERQVRTAIREAGK